MTRSLQPYGVTWPQTTLSRLIDPLWLIDATWRGKTCSSMIQVMACHLFGGKSLSKPMLTFFNWTTPTPSPEEISAKSEWEYTFFIEENPFQMSSAKRLPFCLGLKCPVAPYTCGFYALGFLETGALVLSWFSFSIGNSNVIEVTFLTNSSDWFTGYIYHAKYKIYVFFVAKSLDRSHGIKPQRHGDDRKIEWCKFMHSYNKLNIPMCMFGLMTIL